ncbi:MAG: T9SS type A sorting domain-containing protein [Bacteroidota bacterium]|nr:T9SS type A sorting domain-containing protein [Bacteroidota bacterium]
MQQHGYRPQGGCFSSERFRTSRIDVHFIGASPLVSVSAEEQLPGYESYYGHALSPGGCTGIRKYRKVILRGVWPLIDIVFSVHENGHEAVPILKYSFVIRPGGNPAAIALAYEGQTAFHLRSKRETAIDAPGGFVRETLSACYAVPEDCMGKLDVSDISSPAGGGTFFPSSPVEASFLVKKNTLRFAVGKNISPDYLVIDPTIQWATYYGGTSGDYVLGVSTDPTNNVVACGWTQSTTMIATAGAYQTTLAGTSDAFVVRFSPTGVRLWATYFGGSGNDFANAVSARSPNAIAVAGMTSSTSGIATAGAQQTAFAGGLYDGFLLKMNAAGYLQWATYFGGPETDECRGVSLNSGGDIAVCGRTASPSGIATAGAHQTVFGGGNDDAFIALYTPIGSLSWASYFGGAQGETANAVSLESAGTVVFAGTTESPNGIASIGAFSTALKGTSDAFVAKFSPSGARLWGTYYGGPGEEAGLGVATDNNGFIALSGWTTSMTDIATVGAHQSSYQLNRDAFLIRLSGNGSLQWGTYFGGAFRDEASAVAMDAAGDIFITGTTESLNGISTPGAHQLALSVAPDAFLAKISLSGGQLWGTYLGGSGSDAAFSLAVDASGSPVIGGMTDSPASVSTTGSHQPSFGGGTMDGFVAKFNGAHGTNNINILAVSKDTLCAGETVQITFSATGNFLSGNVFTAQLSNPLGYFSPPTAIGQLASTTSGAITAIIPTSAVNGSSYRVRVVSSNPPFTSADNGRDLVIYALPDTSLAVISSQVLCTGDSVPLCAVIKPDYTYQWFRNGTPIAGADNSCYTAHTGGTYAVRISNRGKCPLMSRQILVQEIPLPDISIHPYGTAGICEGDTVLLRASVSPGCTLQWFRDGTELVGANDTVLHVSEEGLYRALVRSSTGCARLSDIVRVEVHPLPVATVTPSSPVVLCNGDSIVFLAGGSVGVSCQWQRDGFDVPGAIGTRYTAREPGSYRVVVSDRFGCTSASPAVVVRTETIPQPQFDSPGPIDLCFGDSIRLHVGPPGAWSIQWLRNGSPITGAVGEGLTVREGGTYVVEFRGQAGCFSHSLPLIVHERPAPQARVRADRITACSGDSITLRASFDPSCIVMWTLNGAEFAPAVSDTLVVRVSGRYGIFVVDKYGCRAHSAPIDIVFDSLPDATVRVESPAEPCEGDTVFLYALPVADMQYTWLRDSLVIVSDTNTCIHVTESGSYRLVVTSPTGCRDSSRIISVSFGTRPALTLQGRSSVCTNSEYEYRALVKTGVEIAWHVQGGDLLTQPGEYTARVRWKAPGSGFVRVVASVFGSFCRTEYTLPVEIGDSMRPRVEPSGKVHLCGDEKITLTADSGFVSYRWNTGDTSTAITVDSPGWYFVRVHDSQGCSGTSDPVVVTWSPKPVPVIQPSGPLTLCEGDSIVLDAGAFRRWVWSTGDTTRNLTIREAVGEHEYTVLVEDSNGCRGQADPVRVRISERPRPIVSLIGSNPFCEGDSIVLAVLDRYASYRWTDGRETPSIAVRATGSYAVTVSDSVSGCEGTSDTIDVIALPVPMAKVTGPSSVCTGREGRFTVPFLDGAVYRWRVSRGDMVSGAGTNSVLIHWSASTKDTVFVEVLSPDGCRNTGFLEVETGDRIRVPLKPSGDAFLCAGDTMTVEAPAGFERYRWSNGDTTNRIPVWASGNYWVFVWDSSGCEGVSDTAHVFIRPLPQPRITCLPDSFVCMGDSVIADAGEKYRAYAWSTGDTTRFVTIRSDTHLQVRVTDDAGCVGISPGVSVAFLPRTVPAVIAHGSVEFCEGDSVVLEAYPPRYAAYRWNSGDTTRTIVVRRSGAFAVKTDSMSRCPGWSDTIFVRVHPLPAVPTIHRNGDTLMAPPASAYRWFENGSLLAGEIQRWVVGRKGAVYVVEVTNEFGCRAVSAPFHFEDMRASTTISLPTMAAEPGTRVVIPLALDTSVRFPRGVHRLTAQIRFHRDLLLPLQHAYRDSLDQRIVSIAAQDDPSSDTVFRFPAMAMLGPVPSTPLVFQRFQWDDESVVVQTRDGEFRLRICEEGGPRLFDDKGGPLLLRNRPNPFNATTHIEYTCIEEGHVELVVLDVLGKRIAVLAEGRKAPGSYSVVFDASELSSGVYLCVLTTPSQRVVRRLDVVK